MLCYNPDCMPYNNSMDGLRVERQRGDTIVSVSVTFVRSLDLCAIVVVRIHIVSYGPVSNSDGDSYFSSI